MPRCATTNSTGTPTRSPPTLTERGLPNFVRSGPDGANFADVSAARGARAHRAGARQAADGPQGVDRARGLDLRHVDRRARRRSSSRPPGVKVVGVGAHNFRAIDLTDSCCAPSDAAPDVWIQTGYVPDGNLLLRTPRDQGFKPPAILFVGTGDTFETLRRARRGVPRRALRRRPIRAPTSPRRYGPGAGGLPRRLQGQVQAATRSPRRA